MAGGQTTHNLKIVLTGDAAGLQASLQAAGVDLARVQSTGAATSTTLGTIGAAAAEAAREIGSATTAVAAAITTIGTAGAALAEAARSVGQVGAATRTAAQALDVAAQSGGQAAAQFALLGNSAGGAGGQVERMSLRAGAALQALVGNAQRGTAAAAAAAKAAEDAANAAKGTGIQAGAAVEAVAGRLGQLTAGVRQGVTILDRSAAAGVASAGRFGAAAQQAGYQIGDFAVQVSLGQSAIIAFLQQGTQLLQFFGPLGAVVGAAMAVAGGLAVGLMNAGGGATAAEKATRALTAAQEELSLSMAASLQDVEALASEYARMTREAQTLEMALLSVEQRRQQKALEANLAAFKEAMTAALDDATSGQRLLWEDEKERIRQADDVVAYFEAVNTRIKNAGSNPEVFTGLADAAAPFAAIARDIRQAAEETTTQIEALELATSGAASATERLGTVSSSLGTFIDRAAGAKDAAPGLRDLAQSMRLLEGIKLEKDAFEALTSGVISEQQYTAVTEAIGRFVKEGDAAFKKATGSAATFTSAVDNQRAKLLEVVDTFIRADSAASSYYQSVTVASQKLSADQARELAGLKALGEALKGLQRAAGQLDGAAGAVELEGVSSAIGKLATLSKEIAEYRAEVDAARAAVDAAVLSEDRRTAALTALEGSVKKLGEAEAVYVQGLRRLTAATAAEAEEVEYKNQLMALELAGYDGASEAVASLVREREMHALVLERETALNALNTKLLTADVGAQQAIRDEIAQTTAAYERLFEAKAVQQALQDQRRMVEAELKGPMGQAFANFAGEVEDNFKDAWKEAFKAGEGGFERLMDAFENMFLDMLAELAYQALAKPVIVPVLQQVGGALGLSEAATNKALGVEGGGTGGLGLGGVGGEGLFKSDFFTKPWVSIGGGGSPVASTASSYGISVADAAAGIKAGTLTPPASSLPSLQFGAGQALGAAGVAFSAYNFAKDPSVGSGLGLLGSGAALASSMSPALAAMAPWLGPAGIALAVAGPLIGSLFKKKPANPSMAVGINADGSGAFSAGGATAKHLSLAEAQAMGEPIATAVNQTLQQLLPGAVVAGSRYHALGYDQRKGVYAVHDESGMVAEYKDQAQAVADLIFRVIKGGDYAGVGEDIATAVRNSTASNLQELAADIAFVRGRDTMFDAADAVGALEGATRTLVDQYEAATAKAEQLGVSTDKMTVSFLGALTRLAEPEAVTGPFEAAVNDWRKAMALATEAAADGADQVAAAWERAGVRLRAGIVESLDREIRGLSGLGWVDELQDVLDAGTARRRDLTRAGIGTDRGEALTRAQLRQVLEGLDLTELTAAADRFGGVVAEVAVEVAAAAELTDVRERLLDTYGREATALEQLESRWASTAASLREAWARNQIGERSPLAPGAQLEEARRLWLDALGRSRSPDAEVAQAAMAEMTSLGQQYLDVALANLGASEAYYEVWRQVQAELLRAGAVAEDQAAILRDQRQLMQQQLIAMGVLTAATEQGFAQLVAAFQAAEAARSSAATAAAAAGGAGGAGGAAGGGTVAGGGGAVVVPGTPSGESGLFSREELYLAANPDVMAWAQDLAAQSGATGQAYREALNQWAAHHYQNHGISEGRQFARGGFVTPGLALVGEQGPEVIDVRTPARVYSNSALGEALQTAPRDDSGVQRQMAILVSMVANLTAEVAGLRDDTGRHHTEAQTVRRRTADDLALTTASLAPAGGRR